MRSHCGSHSGASIKIKMDKNYDLHATDDDMCELREWATDTERGFEPDVERLVGFIRCRVPGSLSWINSKFNYPTPEFLSTKPWNEQRVVYPYPPTACGLTDDERQQVEGKGE